MMKIFLFLAATSSFATDLSIKNFREIFESYALITGVPRTDAEVIAKFNDVKTKLPQKGAVEEISSPMTFAVTQLAIPFCKKMIAADANRPVGQRLAHKKIDFLKAPKALFTADIVQATVKDY